MNPEHDDVAQDALGVSPSIRPRAKSQSPMRIQMPTVTPEKLAISAMRYLPVPIIVLNSLKTVVLANDAMGRMMGDTGDSTPSDVALSSLETLRGQTLSQVGIDMLQDGRPVWISWESFLDTLATEAVVQSAEGSGLPPQETLSPGAGDTTPTGDTKPPPSQLNSLGDRQTRDAAVEVVISRKDLGKTTFDTRYKSKESEHQIFANMIVTVWELEDKQTFFTLTFTKTQSVASSPSSIKKSTAKLGILEVTERRTISSPTPSSVTSSRESSSPSFLSPGVVTMSSSPFPPLGPPSMASQSRSPSLLQKITLMKDALLDNTQMPIIAMWKDGSVIFPNKAARLLLPSDTDLDISGDGFDLWQKWELWTEDFARRLEFEEYPVSVLIRTESPFPSMRAGLINRSGKRLIYDYLGEAIRDDTTGEFLAGVVTGRDVTTMSEEITQIKERGDEQFKLICDTMPQLVWTATPDGTPDFFNTRWYSFTGLTPDECLGTEWQMPLHPDDRLAAMNRWQQSLQTGKPYAMEYRCRSTDGEWRWFLGRALAVRNKDTGDIEKWFGTCTDVHESIETKFNAKRTRQQLLSVIAHSHVTIFTVDPSRRVTMLEGALIWNNTAYEDIHDDSRWFIDENMYTVFNRLTEQLPEGVRPLFLQPIEDILDGKSSEDVKEHGLGSSLPHAVSYP